MNIPPTVQCHEKLVISQVENHSNAKQVKPPETSIQEPIANAPKDNLMKSNNKRKLEIWKYNRSLARKPKNAKNL